MRAGGVPGVQWSRSNQGLLISRKFVNLLKLLTYSLY